MEEEEVKSYFKTFGNTGKSYIDNRIKLVKIEASEKIGSIATVIFTGFIVGMLAFFLMFFLSIMAGYFFAEYTQSLVLGFAIVAGIYLLLMLVFWIWIRKWISKKIFDLVTDIMLTDIID